MSHDETVGELLERALRQLVREELAAVLGKGATAVPAVEPGGRTSPTGWQKVNTMSVKGEFGSREYTTQIGWPCKVAGLGKRTTTNPEGSVAGGFRITDIERRPHAGAYEYNVTVVRNGESRIVKGDRIFYQRPPKKT